MAKKTAKAAAKALVIVESPAKAKTINKYLGSDYIVKACKGHVRDLPKHRYGIDPGRNFEPQYELLDSHKRVIDELRTAARGADEVYLATDLDREGEAIAWHLAQALEIPPQKAKRVIFNEITKAAIQSAFEHPHALDQDKVNAQQARRILDRIVGYELSPLLWKKIAKGLSAGRVQSVAVRMIVERENEIRAFQPEEYWSVEAVLAPESDRVAGLREAYRAKFTDAAGDGPTAKERAAWLEQQSAFVAELVEVDGKEFKPSGTLKFDKQGNPEFVSASDRVREVVEALGLTVRETRVEAWPEYERLALKKVALVTSLNPSASVRYAVLDVETKRTRSKPPGPFTTASLQQAAANQLRFATSRTMRTAQTLYEGVDLGDGEGPVGLITYMRTDSTHLSAESLSSVRGLIQKQFGDAYLPASPQAYGNTNKSAQEAHEAIRPTDARRTPDSMRGHLNDEQLKLYTLIWNRFVACQMNPAEWDATTVRVGAETSAGKAVLKAGGRVLKFDGFYKVAGVPRADGEPTLPALAEKQPVAAVAIEPRQRYTQPPARYTEASLVKTLEAEGIGRPSTYSAIIDTVQKRGYVEQIDRRFYPTERGMVVTNKLIEHFPQVMDLKFTSHMEDQLDKIEEAHLDWVSVLHEFYDPFRESLGKAHDGMEAVRAEPSPYTCELCGKPMVYRLGKNGRFLSCTGYPECKGTLNVDREGKPLKPVLVDLKCEKCGRPMQLRKSRTGPFLGCSGYPECSTTVPCDEAGNPLRRVKAEELKETCTECGSPMRVSFFRGRSFLGCTNYPTCKATRPMPEGIYVEKPPAEQAGVNCDKCGRPMVIRKSRRGPFLSCSGFPKCRNAKSMDKLDELKKMMAEGTIPAPPAEEPAAKGRGGKKGAGKSRTAAAGGAATPYIIPEGQALPDGVERSRTGKMVVAKMNGAVQCLACGSEMNVKPGRWGPFLSCSNFPRCRETARLKGEALKQAEEAVGKPEPRAKPIPTDVDCPDCGSKMLLRMGRTGRFLGCGSYPKCKKTMEPPPGLLRELATTEAAS